MRREYAWSFGYLQVAPDLQLYYEVHGDGPPLVCVPGWTFSGEVFEHQVAHFARTHRVIVYDPRSQGRSTVTPDGNDYLTHGRDLAQLLAALQLRDVVLLGWSTGALALLAAVRAAGTRRLRAAVMIDMPPKPLSEQPDDWVETALPEVAAPTRRFLRAPNGQRDFILHYAAAALVQRPLTAGEREWLLTQSLRTPTATAGALFADAMFCDFRSELQQLAATVPTFYVLAESSAPTARPYLQRCFPTVQTAVLGGHMMFWEHAAAFNALLEGFLASAARRVRG